MYIASSRYVSKNTYEISLKNSLKQIVWYFRKGGGDDADVLDDIGNMLANLTDELDAMLEEEKRQGLIDDWREP